MVLNMSMENVFSLLTDDIILNIFLNLEDDPRHWARLASVCTKFSSLIRNFCWKNKCSHTIPSIVSHLLSDSDSSAPPAGWASLHKLAVCCPGLHHAGVLLETSDFGLTLELGPDDNYHHHPQPLTISPSPSLPQPHVPLDSVDSSVSDCCWSLFDDLYYDTVYNASESHDASQPLLTLLENVNVDVDVDAVQRVVNSPSSSCKKRKICRSWGSHLASGIWNFSREQGSKLLARQFRDDCLYICDWPGCVHFEEKRKYRLFRGVFKNFKRTRVWRTINDGNRKKLDLSCAFCMCNETWDLYSAFCLRRGFGYHDDGEPVVRAYVCENGHVSGAWTDVPMYT